MKAEIEKILEELCQATCDKENYTEEMITKATFSLTALIIKWLEGKRKNVSMFQVTNTLYVPPPIDGDIIPAREYINNDQRIGRNQLITELIGEVR
jgi:hypothetical protein